MLVWIGSLTDWMRYQTWTGRGPCIQYSKSTFGISKTGRFPKGSRIGFHWWLQLSIHTNELIQQRRCNCNAKSKVKWCDWLVMSQWIWRENIAWSRSQEKVGERHLDHSSFTMCTSQRHKMQKKSMNLRPYDSSMNPVPLHLLNIPNTQICFSTWRQSPETSSLLFGCRVSVAEGFWPGMNPSSEKT